MVRFQCRCFVGEWISLLVFEKGNACCSKIMCSLVYAFPYQLFEMAYVLFLWRCHIQQYIEMGQGCLVIYKVIMIICGWSTPLFSFKPMVMINTIECFEKTVKYKWAIFNNQSINSIVLILQNRNFCCFTITKLFFPLGSRLCIVLLLQMSMPLGKNQYNLNSPRRVQGKYEVILFKFSMNI